MKVSVALCTYNGGNFIEEQLESILSQTIPVNEIIICDDYSIDQTLSIINKFIDNYPSIIKLLKNEVNVGAKKSFEKAIKFASGDLVFLSDQDDIWLENKVEVYLEYFKNNKKCLLLFSDAILIDSDSNDLSGSLWENINFNNEVQLYWKSNQNIISDLIKNHNKVTGATVCFRRKIIKKILPFDLPFNYWHDAWMTLIAARENGVHFIKDKLTKYRIHSNQQIGLTSGHLLKNNKKFFEISENEFSLTLLKLFPKHKKDIFERYGNHRANYIFTLINDIKRIIKKYLIKI
jgi:glycosyltransferase involved in cell wall biosynthesis